MTTATGRRDGTPCLTVVQVQPSPCLARTGRTYLRSPPGFGSCAACPLSCPRVGGVLRAVMMRDAMRVLRHVMARDGVGWRAVTTMTVMTTR